MRAQILLFHVARKGFGSLRQSQALPIRQCFTAFAADGYAVCAYRKSLTAGSNSLILQSPIMKHLGVSEPGVSGIVYGPRVLDGDASRTADWITVLEFQLHQMALPFLRAKSPVARRYMRWT